MSAGRARRRAGIAALVGAAVVCWGPRSSVAGQGKPAGGVPEPPIFSEQIQVEIVELEVLVSDRDGKPVTGLDRGAFEVRVDGKPVEIANFYAVTAAADPGAPEAAGAEETVVPFDRRLRLVVVVDLRSLPFGHGRAVLDDVADGLVETLHDGDQVLVASLERQLDVVQPFTGDRELAAQALRAVGKGSARAGAAERELRGIVQELSSVSPPSPSGSGEGGFASQAETMMVEAMARDLRISIDHYAEQRVFEARATAQLLATMVDRLSGLDGRKVVLYVGGGIEDRPGEALVTAWRDKFSHPAYGISVGVGEGLPQATSLSPVFARVGEHANAKGVIFYALAPDTGLRSLGVSAEVRGLDPATGGNLAADVGAAYDAARGAPLMALAAQTGGNAWVRGGDVGGFLGQLRRDSQSYYSLGIRLPGADAVDKQHRVRVSVDRPGARVRHQATVRPRTAAEKAEAATLAALVHGEGENGLDVAVEFGEAEVGEKGLVLLPMTVRFPFVHLLLVPQGDYHVGQATLLIAAMDGDQDLSSTHVAELPIRVPTGDLVNALQGLAQYEARLMIRPGRHRIAVGLHDEIGDVTSTLVAEHDAIPPDGT